jgi:hypothetical protein
MDGVPVGEDEEDEGSPVPSPSALAAVVAATRLRESVEDDIGAGLWWHASGRGQVQPARSSRSKREQSR